MAAYYNEIDAHKAEWLRRLIAAGHIAAGDVDERSIVDVRPDDLRGYRQCHFFAGVGTWSYSLRLAGWGDHREVWTASCPCQPFSSAGSRAGLADERHLWPAAFHLVEQCGPRIVFGEQVASPDGLAWLDVVQADLESAGYAVGALDICSAGFGAPHIRQRLHFVADAGCTSGPAEQQHEPWSELGRQSTAPDTSRIGQCREHGELGNATLNGEWAFDREPGSILRLQESTGGSGLSERLGHTERSRLEGFPGYVYGTPGWSEQVRPIAPAGIVNGFWAGAELVWCRDEKYRPVEPGTFPLAHGAPARVGRLRAYGDSINAQVAAEFVSAYMEVAA